ncbi:MAG: 3-dehydroquinate dehydratase [Thermoleophilia bacterium]|nr:3-dehydroquinate dehydratase [Thermoleophilia bacterium]
MSTTDIRVAVLHGPNINTLGRRPAAHYGTITLPDLEQQIRGWATERGIRVGCFQTNDEGAFLSHLHGLSGLVDAAIVNPGAWTHYQWSIRDALEILAAPFVEVHLSDVEAREPHRKISVVRDIAAKAIWGKGPDAYREALDAIPGLVQ